MNDRYMQRRIAWHTEGYIDTDIVRTVALKKALENMDPVSLKRLLNTSYGLTPAYNAIQTMMALHELQRRNKEEKKMHKKQKVNGHVVHKLPKCENLYYTVEPENSRITVHVLKHDEGTGELYYYYYGYMQICTKQLGRHGYLQEEINWLIRRYSDTTSFKEEKIMKIKVKDLFKITVDGKTQQTISIFDDGVEPAWFYFEYDSAFKQDAIDSLLHYIGSMEIGVPHIQIINSSSCFPYRKIRYVTKDVTKDILMMLKRLGVFGDVTKHKICIEDVPSGVTGKLHIGGGEFSYGITRDELVAGSGSLYYYIPENRDPTVLEFKNGKYVRGDNDGGLTAFAPFNLWRSIFGDNRFYETWADVKKAVVEAINNRKIYVNAPHIPELKEENCYIK